MVTGSSGAIGLRKCMEVTCLENLNVDTGAHSFIIFSPTNDSCPKQDQKGWRMVPRKTWVSGNFGRISKSRKRF